MKRVLPILLLVSGCLLVTACAPSVQTPVGVPVPPVAEDTCGAAPFAPLVGQDATALEKVLILKPVRIIRPGMAVTADFSAMRMNFDVGADGRIARIFCG